MADVHRGIDRTTGEAVAVKVLRGEMGESVARFQREAALLAQLDHPAIVSYRAHGLTPAGEYYLVMEWLEGEDLYTRLARSNLSLAETTALATQVAVGLQCAHNAGIVHRDIKPGNLFLLGGRASDVKVIDFGIALLGQGSTLQSDPRMTMGSPGYMSPEQAQTGRTVGPAADVYGLGCVLFRCLTGRRPFEGDSPMAVMLKTVIETPPRVSDLVPEIPPALDMLVARMLAKRPRDRPASAAAVADALAQITPAAASRARARPTPSITSGESRIVSLVLADVGLRAATGQLSRPATDERSLELDSLAEVVLSFGGTMSRISERLIVVTLEGSDPKEQSARAARCALAMHESTSGAPIVLATGRSSIDPLPVGEVIDTAVALLERVERARARAPDARGELGIHLDDATAGLLDARFLIRSTLHGAMLEAERTVEAARTLLGRPTPFVGRIRELGFLEAIFDETLSDSAANVALVTAEAGVGKSRLRHEFLRVLRRRKRPIEMFFGRGDPIGAGSPFATIAPVIRRAAGFLPGDSELDQHDKLRDRLARHLADEPLRRVSTFLGELVGLRPPTRTDVQLRTARSDPMLMGDQMRRAWLEWLEAELGDEPVVLVLEDLHWGDRPSVGFVDEALRRFHDRPLMVLALARPEVDEVFPDLWSERRLTRIALRELSRAASATLVREVLGDRATDELADDLAARAMGNAFYLEELIRATAENRMGELPESVLAMVQARLESLDAKERILLRAASVFGRVFTPSGVRVLLGGPEKAPHVRSRLHTLAERELVTRTVAAGEGPDDVTYTFRHALVRDAAYAMLTDEDRQLGHRLAGEWLESHGERDPMILAEHFERGDRPRRAFRWYLRAAEQALEGNDFEATHGRCERAMACAPDDPARGRLDLLRAEATRWQGVQKETIEHGLQAMKRLPAGSAHWFQAAGLAAIAAGNTGDSVELERIGAALLGAQPDEDAIGAYLTALSRAGDRMLIVGKYQLAEPLIARMRELAGTQGEHEPDVAGWIHRIRGFRALFLGDPASFANDMIEAAYSFEAAGDLRNACLQRGNAGYGYLHVGDYEWAETVLREALVSARELDLGNVTSSVMVDLGLVLARLGKVAESITTLEDAVSRCNAQSSRRLLGCAHAYLALARVRSGDLAGAADAARSAIRDTRDHPPARATALAALATVHLARAEPAEALRAANRAMAQLQLLGDLSEGESLVRVTYAEALRAAGQPRAAAEAIRAAQQRVEVRAKALVDPRFRACFLSREDSNVRTAALYRELVGGRVPG